MSTTRSKCFLMQSQFQLEPSGAIGIAHSTKVGSEPEGMAEVAVVGNATVGVAVHAGGHRGRNLLREDVSGCDRSMTRLAGNARFAVIGMVEEDKLGHLIHTYPGDLLTGCLELSQDLDFVARGFDGAMAQHAAICLRQPRSLLRLSRDMTVFAD